jgi:hypothetical protein
VADSLIPVTIFTDPFGPGFRGAQVDFGGRADVTCALVGMSRVRLLVG